MAKNRNLDHSDNYKTPDSFYSELDDEFEFDFDPCPYFEGEITPENDGLLKEWGKSNFINPPYSRVLKEEFVSKAVVESKKGKTCVMLLPVSTSTKLFHDVIKPNAKEIRFVKGRIKFETMNANGVFETTKNSGMHDSMIVIF
jgi:site-specific DNA-methyltransferase (adenine-specific)